MDDRRRTKDDGRPASSDGKSSRCLWQGDFIKSSPLKLLSQMNMGNNKITELRTIFQRESQNKTTDDGRQVMVKTHVAFGKVS
jgi:hypothetical protein